MASPTRLCSFRRPGHRPAPGSQAGTEQRNCRDPARSPWITSSTLSPRSAGITCGGPFSLAVRFCGTGLFGSQGGKGSSASPFASGSPPRPALHRFTTRSNLRLCLCPLCTPSRLDALGIGYRTSTTKAREGLSPPCWRSCQAYRDKPPRRTGAVCSKRRFARWLSGSAVACSAGTA